MRNKVQRGLWLLLAGLSHAAQADEGLTGWQPYGYAKAMYVGDDKQGGRANQNTLGFGGKLGVKTTDEESPVALRTAWYTTTDFGLRRRNPKEVDAYMFSENKQPYSIWGEAVLALRHQGTELAIGRMELETPMLASGDYRIIPNLFEGWTLMHRANPSTKLTLGYIDKMAGLDAQLYTEFKSMSQQVYPSLMMQDGKISGGGDTADLSTLVGEHGVWLAGVEYGQQNRAQLWAYRGVDTFNTVYADGKYLWPLNDQWTAGLEAQVYSVHGAGRLQQYLSRAGLNADYALLGLRGTLRYQPAGVTLGLARNRFTGNDKTVTAYTSWGAYPEFVIMPYVYAEQNGVNAIAGSQLSRVTALLDLQKVGLAGHSLLLMHTRVNLDEAIQPDSRISSNAMIYRASLTKALALRWHTEWRSSPNTRYDNKFMAVSLRYEF